jgi:4'-phosphopantetheinyl transferase EntD
LHAAEPLLPAEKSALGAVSVRRHREFAAGRTCARRALAHLDKSTMPILPGPHRAPLWPDGVTGSISHCRSISAAAVGSISGPFVKLGIDVEEYRPLADRVGRVVLNDQERRWLGRIDGRGIHWDMVIFSAKESVLKAWGEPACGWLMFPQIEVRLSPSTSTFSVRIHGSELGDPDAVPRSGRFAIDTDLIRTAVSVPVRDPAEPRHPGSCRGIG